MSTYTLIFFRSRLLWLFIFLCPTVAFSSSKINWGIDAFFWNQHGFERIQSQINPNSEHTILLGLDLRPFLKFKKYNWSASLRGRFELRSSSEELQCCNNFVDEAWAAYQGGDAGVFTFGIQNFQWGAAELWSPSNPLFPLNLEASGIVAFQRGIALVKYNSQVSASLNVSAAGEIFKTADPFVSQEKWQPQGLLKIEYSVPQSLTYLGFSGGHTSLSGAFLGQYASLAVVEGASLYWDSRYELKKDSTDKNLFLTTGLRNESAWLDTRVEYLFYPKGYNGANLGQALVSGAFNPQGLELLGQHHLYLSIRWAKNAASRTWNLAGRYLTSLKDRSGALGIVYDWVLSDNFVVFFEPSFIFGAADTAFGINPLHSKYFFGVKGSW